MLPKSAIRSQPSGEMLSDGRIRRVGPDRVLEASGFESLAARLALAGTKAAAAEAGVSVRTLHRTLAKRGTTVQTLVRRFRRERVLRLLGDVFRLDKVAEAVGLSGPSALARYCRKEFGRTAGELRKELVLMGWHSHLRCRNVARNVNRRG